jgi:hypothetical protein
MRETLDLLETLINNKASAFIASLECGRAEMPALRLFQIYFAHLLINIS